MSLIPPVGLSPSGVAALDQALPQDPSNAAGFGAAIGQALQSVVTAGHDADAKSMQAIAGGGNLTDVVTAVSKAELALQTTLAIRDHAVLAYQDVMRMAI